MRTTRKFLALALAAAILPGCGGEDKDGRSVAETTPPTAPVSSQALFAPSTADSNQLPFPTDLFFAGTYDFTINVPGQPSSFPTAVPAPSASYNPALDALNSLDGFSTVATQVLRFDGALNPDASILATGVRIFEMDSWNPADHDSTALLGLAPLSVNRELIWGIDFVAGISQGTTMLIIPLKPLASHTTYVVTANSNLVTTTGEAVSEDEEYLGIKGLALNGIPAALEDGTANACNIALFSAGSQVCAVNPVAEAALGGVTLDLAGAVQLETLRQITLNQYQAIDAFDSEGSVAATAAPIVLSHSVSTQELEAQVNGAMAQVTADSTPEIVGLTGAGTSAGGAANVFQGLLTGMLQFVDPSDPNSTRWTGSTGLCPFPTLNLTGCNGYVPTVVESSWQVPVLVTAPTDAVISGACGDFTDLPVVIYQHGITSNRASLLAFADRLAAACIIGVAIDLPKHGVPSNATLGEVDISGLSLGATERLTQTDSGASDCETPLAIPYSVGGTGYHCVSGDTFINLTDLANSRDTLRQGAVDMYSLYQAIQSGSEPLSSGALGTAKGGDAANVSFVGVSLGGINGVRFVDYTIDDGASSLSTATFSVTAGGIAKHLDGSPTYEPIITAGLQAAAGIVKPSGDYEGFLILAQTLLDSMDPVNFASSIADNQSVLVHEVVGNGEYVNCVVTGERCPDQVVVNNVFGLSFGPAWGVVSGNGQVGFQPNQNAFTTPGALAGTDPFAQGTSFVLVDASVDDATAAAIGPIDAASAIGGPATLAFYGLNARELGAQDTFAIPGASNLVRFTDGTHGSLLDPTVADVNELMQLQVAAFIASGGTQIVADPNAGTDDQVVRIDGPVIGP